MRKDLLQLGVQSPLRVVGVLLDPGKVCAVRRLGLTPGFALDLRTGWDLNDPAHRAKSVVTSATRKTNFDCWKLEWSW